MIKIMDDLNSQQTRRISQHPLTISDSYDLSYPFDVVNNGSDSTAQNPRQPTTPSPSTSTSSTEIPTAHPGSARWNQCAASSYSETNLSLLRTELLATFFTEHLFTRLPSTRLTDEEMTFIKVETEAHIYTAIYHTRVSSQAVVSSLLYLNRIFPHGIPYSGVHPQHCIDLISRLFSLGLRLGTIQFEDHCLPVFKFWCVLGAISTAKTPVSPIMRLPSKQILQMDLNALDLLGFTTNISPTDWTIFLSQLLTEGQTLFSSSPSSSSSSSFFGPVKTPDYSIFHNLITSLYPPLDRPVPPQPCKYTHSNLLETVDPDPTLTTVLSEHQKQDQRGRLAYLAIHGHTLPPHQLDFHIHPDSDSPAQIVPPRCRRRRLLARIDDAPTTTSSSSGPFSESSSPIVKIEQVELTLLWPSSPPPPPPPPLTIQAHLANQTVNRDGESGQRPIRPLPKRGRGAAAAGTGTGTRQIRPLPRQRGAVGRRNY